MARNRCSRWPEYAEYEEGHLVNGANRISIASLERFEAKYVFQGKLSKELSCTHHALRKAIDLAAIPITELRIIEARKPRVTCFVDRRLLNDLKVEKERPIRPIQPPKRRSLVLLEKYLHKLASEKEFVPFRGSNISKAGISRESGVPRSYLNGDEFKAMIKKIVEEEAGKHNFKQLSDYQKLEEYAVAVSTGQEFLPRGHHGRINKKRIAERCGIQRTLFYKNKDALELLKRMESEIS